MLDIELISSPPVALGERPLELLEARIASARDELDRLADHQVVIDDLQGRRLCELRRGLSAVSERLRYAERAADVLDARLADAVALIAAQRAEIASLIRRIIALEAR